MRLCVNPNIFNLEVTKRVQTANSDWVLSITKIVIIMVGSCDKTKTKKKTKPKLPFELVCPETDLCQTKQYFDAM